MKNGGPPLVAHVLLRFDTGGLENGVVNLVNHMPPDAYRHLIVAMTEVTSFRQRLKNPSVDCVALGKTPGHGAKLYPKLWRLLRERRPAIVHTRNLAALEMQPAAWAAGVPVRLHGEHGRDVDDLDGSSVRHQRIRRLYAPFVHRFVALSVDLERYLTQKVGVPASRVEQIYNGVDTDRFAPPRTERPPIEGCPFHSGPHWLVGTVGRLQPVKDQMTLARAFAQLIAQRPQLAERARLVVVGDGALRSAVQQELERGGVAHLAWLPGERRDVPEVMRGLDCFVLPSLAEGISNTILEAMASALPVVATAVGGNVELVVEGETGLLVPAADPAAMAAALDRLASVPGAAQRLGAAGRARVESRFSLRSMVGAYRALYDRRLALAGAARRTN